MDQPRPGGGVARNLSRVIQGYCEVRIRSDNRKHARDLLLVRRRPGSRPYRGNIKMGVGMVLRVRPYREDEGIRLLASRGRAWVCGSVAPAGSGTGER